MRFVIIAWVAAPPATLDDNHADKSMPMLPALQLPGAHLLSHTQNDSASIACACATKSTSPCQQQQTELGSKRRTEAASHAFPFSKVHAQPPSPKAQKHSARRYAANTADPVQRSVIGFLTMR
jgi:hypothetical protein